ncbi:DNA-binding protein [Candidatus Woesearchaeota archaeon]|nr:DNA-binding protein [Candidatus Woesearchaeota archaeon]
MKEVILDTNFLMAVSQFKVDIFSELKRICDFPYELFIIDKTINELESIIEEQKGKHKAAAKLALAIIKNKKIKKIKTKEGTVDELILGIADKDTVVATQDMELKRKLRKKRVSLIVLRQKKYLVFID